jgi:hypothetical protein
MLILDAIAVLIGRYFESFVVAPKRAGNERPAMKLASEYIDEQSDEDVFLATLAKLVDLSLHNFARALDF